MSRVYISPYDFTPRQTGELSIAKHDHVIISYLENGWYWGKNITKGGQEGVFPKRFLNGPRSGASGFYAAVDEVASACSSMDMLIARSPWLTSAKDRESLLSRHTRLNSMGPITYLTLDCAGGIWEDCLQNFVSAFQETKVRPHEYQRCVENLKRIAAILDRCIPDLTEEIRKYARVVPDVLRNAKCMQATLKGIITTATAAFDWYMPKEIKYCASILSGETLIPSRSSTLRSSDLELILRRNTTIDTIKGTNRSSTSTTTPPAQAHLLSSPEDILTPSNPSTTSPATFLLTGYPTLQALTFLTCVAACAIQLRSYALSPHGPGALGDPDFYANLQSVLMQLLTTYTGLMPALRRHHHHHHASSTRSTMWWMLASAFWLAFLSVAGAALNFAAAGVYFLDGALAPLLGFFGSAVQAVTVLQLAISLDHSRLSVIPVDDL